ncbi:hypothetical protein Tcan_00356, partial [Toxocara canis]
MSIFDDSMQGAGRIDKTTLFAIIVAVFIIAMVLPVLCVLIYACGIFAYISHMFGKQKCERQSQNDPKSSPDRHHKQLSSHSGSLSFTAITPAMSSSTIVV